MNRMPGLHNVAGGPRRPFDGRRRLANVVDMQLEGFHVPQLVDIGELRVKPGEPLVVITERTTTVKTPLGWARRILTSAKLPRVVRRATPQDLEAMERANELAHEAARLHLERQRALKLKMKLVRADVDISHKKVVFYFTAPKRVEFKQLVRDLANGLGMKVEMRQIGVREGAAIIGGLGSCGRELCSSTFLNTFAEVKAVHARAQGFSETDPRAIGLCGRLKCCIVFERGDDSFESLKRYMPAEGSHVMCPGGYGRVLEVNPYNRMVDINIDDEFYITFPLADIVLLDGEPTREEREAMISSEQLMLNKSLAQRGGRFRPLRPKHRRRLNLPKEKYLWERGGAAKGKGADAAAKPQGANAAGAAANQRGVSEGPKSTSRTRKHRSKRGRGSSARQTDSFEAAGGRSTAAEQAPRRERPPRGASERAQKQSAAGGERRADGASEQRRSRRRRPSGKRGGNNKPRGGSSEGGGGE